jgi:hypothetical protein
LAWLKIMPLRLSLAIALSTVRKLTVRKPQRRHAEKIHFRVAPNPLAAGPESGKLYCGVRP